VLEDSADQGATRASEARPAGPTPAAQTPVADAPPVRPPKMVFSHSRISSFDNCRLKFHFRYVQKLPAESEGIEAFVGKRVHEVLERLHMFVDRGQVPSINKVVARFHALWDEFFDEDKIRIAREGTPIDFYKRLGERCLHNYYRLHYPFDAGETLGLEQHVAFSLDDDNEYRMQGIVDRIVRAPDGVIEIQDYKTGARVPSQERLDKDHQLAFYQLGLADEYGADQPMRLVWHYVASGQRRESTRTPEQLERLRKNTIRKIDKIGAEREFAPKQSMLCNWCEYRGICPEFSEKPEGERPLTAMYKAPVPRKKAVQPRRHQLNLFGPRPST
jgi:putative RecB family exonuclease